MLTSVADMEATADWGKLYLVLAALCLCYIGKYFCTADLCVVQVRFTELDIVTTEQLSFLYAVGYFASMFGKVAAGMLCTFFGGRCVMIIAAAGYVAATLLFSMVPERASYAYAAFVALWACVGFFALGLASVALVSTATDWIPAAYSGRFGIVSMAPQLGDAAARLCLAPFLDLGWHVVFRMSTVVACTVTLPVAFCVSSGPASVGPVGERSLSRKLIATPRSSPSQYCTGLRSLFAQPFFWILCFLSGTLYGTRVLFLLFSTNYLSMTYCREATDTKACLLDPHTMSMSAAASSAYTMLGCVSVLLVGTLKDNFPRQHRGATLTLFVAPLFATLMFLSVLGPDLPFTTAASAVAFVGFCLFGPLKILGAVFAVDVGGKELKSTCTAFIGVFDNLFGILMLIGQGCVRGDWGKIFGTLAVLSCFSLVCSSSIWLSDFHAHRRVVALSPSASQPLLVEPVEHAQQMQPKLA
eukprot:CAMPEP_0170216754 /NCGR_PEP_ID=MMETSP0116_2-20130129/8040_1 /TAXON_ID=400756 /ORGANISM="Durinskia baltica, Strain CSIRO CS-38" /LENGTH=470 /DNA_ID=CAMNT_0010467383 /DNA_START=83 /DNA_END=1495 /DNA_ORIENTATION=-